ncbi:MAG: saccharopine dehydrogenase NADP-binding domain-containing protein [Bacteroidales bacterium]|nr:saccharopine dehydrogenase NADP-binding domain-containing protein [Bacteroidales bacterium]
MKRITVIGSGMVGSVMARELSKRHQVTATDISRKSLDSLGTFPDIGKVQLDVTDHDALSSAVTDADIVVLAVPGYLGFRTMSEIIRLKKDLVDISFMPEDPADLNDLAVQNGVTVVTDCGVAPGMSNFIVGYHNARMEINELEYMVGGLPRERKWPFEYKAPFSPTDVIEEYTRPARFVENGRIVIRPAMSDAELVHFKGVGTLEAFNTDGLRSLIRTMKNIPHMREKTLRYPGHINLIRALLESGFLDREPVKINGTGVSPIDFTSRILFKAWKLEDYEEEFTVMRIILRGMENREAREIIYELYDEYDPVEGISSMARTTGYTATGTAEMILSGIFRDKGVFPPELVGLHKECFDFIVHYLKERNVRYEMSSKRL